jgi:outer membrane immunogenic protein
MKSLLLASTILVALSSSVFAADVIDTAPEVSSVATPDYGYDWSGLYLGLQAGIVGADSDYDIDLGDFGSASVSENDFGAIGGAHVGYNYQMGNGLVLGAEADFQATSLGDDLGYDVDYLGTATAKVGYAVDRILVYGKGGFAYGHVDGENVDDLSIESDWKTGYTLGAGLAIGITDSISIRTEYNYVDLDSSDIRFEGDKVGETDAKLHQVTAGVSYKF